MESISLGITILIVLSIIVSAGGVLAIIGAYFAGKIHSRLDPRHRA